MNVILLSGQGPSNQFMSRYAGPHRLATELRNNNITTQIIMGLGYYSVDEIIDLIKSYYDKDTKVIGISTTFFVEYSQRYAIFPSKLYQGNKISSDIPELVDKIKKQFPLVKIVIGGPAARSKIFNSENIDLFIEGYADKILVEYVQSLKNNVSVFYSNYYKNKPLLTNQLDKNFEFRTSTIKYIDSDIIFNNETLPLEISRGCIFNCKFCSYPLRGRSIKDNSYIKSEDNILNELLDNYDKFGTTNYIFVDDTFNDNIEKLKILNKTFKKLPFDLSFAAYIRADLLHAIPESIELLQEMGIKGAFFGIESLNSESRKASSKGFDEIKLLKLIDKVNHQWENVVLTSSFIYGLPHDSSDSIRKWTDDIVFDSGLFSNHDLIFQPLYLQKDDTTFMSDFDLDMAKYGYEFTNDEQIWKNDITSFREMFSLAKEYNLKAGNTKRPFSSFHSVTLLGYGLSPEQVCDLDSHNNSDVEFVENLTIERYKQYYELVKNNLGSR